jgi:tetratricopeptide (TPR) repeat protein
MPPAETAQAEGERAMASANFREAERVLLAALRDAEQRHLRDVEIAAILDDLGATEMVLANYPDAERLLSRSVSLYTRIQGGAGPGVAEAETRLAELYVVEGRPREASALIDRVLAILQVDPAPDALKVALATCDLALVRRLEHRYREAESLLRVVLAQYEAAVGVDHKMLVSVLTALASVLASQHRYTDAIATAQRASEILKVRPAASIAGAAGTMAALGNVYLQAGRLEEAEFYSKNAVAQAEATSGPDHLHVAWCLQNYAGVLKRLNRKDEAKAAEKRARAILGRRENHNQGLDTVNVNALIR